MWVDALNNYPFQKPVVSCLTDIFHPNILRYSSDNICLNLLENWLPHYGLKDILHAFLFLLYEPNFEDALNLSASKPEEGLTIELTIFKSLMGGTVNGIYYTPNETWCNWAKQNNVTLEFPSCSMKSLLEKTNEGSNTSLKQQQSALSGYFLQALSGQFTLVGQSISEGWPHQPNDECPLEFTFIRHITVKPAFSTTCDIEDVVGCSRRYYYAESGNYRKLERIANLTARSACVPTAENYDWDWQSEQTSLIGVWPLKMERKASVTSEDFITQEQHLQREIVLCDDFAETPCLSESECNPQLKENENVKLDAYNRSNGEAADITLPDVLQQQQHSSDVIDESTATLLTNSTAMPAFNDESPSENLKLDIVQHRPDMAEGLSTSVLTVHRDDEEQQQQTADGIPESIDWEDDTSSEVGDSTNISTEYLNLYIREQKRTMTKIEPWFWILYTTRWPPYLAPRRIAEISQSKTQLQGQRVSSTVLHSDLFRLGNNVDGSRLYILVDSLAISPFSPIINRTVSFPNRERNIVTWYSLDWFSVWDVFKPNFAGGSSFTRPKYIRWPTILLGLCYVHNWVAYLSRMELYGLCLGYSRPWRNEIYDHAAASCLTPATLGCGRCGLLDVWPLWLAWRTTRVLCHLVSLFSTQTLPQMAHRNAHHRLYFPFSDLDEI